MEDEKYFISEEQAQLSDLLEQINKVNSMILMHRDAGEESMLSQYRGIRQRFVEELQELLQKMVTPYQLTVYVEPRSAA